VGVLVGITLKQHHIKFLFAETLNGCSDVPTIILDAIHHHGVVGAFSFKEVPFSYAPS
jgi:hypothetical protein